jgi:hypothetical protein
MPGDRAVTVAVRVTDWPKTEGLADEASAVLEGAWITDWFTVPLLVAKLLSPP